MKKPLTSLKIQLKWFLFSWNCSSLKQSLFSWNPHGFSISLLHLLHYIGCINIILPNSVLFRRTWTEQLPIFLPSYCHIPFVSFDCSIQGWWIRKIIMQTKHRYFKMIIFFIYSIFRALFLTYFFVLTFFFYLSTVSILCFSWSSKPPIIKRSILWLHTAPSIYSPPTSSNFWQHIAMLKTFWFLVHFGL